MLIHGLKGVDGANDGFYEAGDIMSNGKKAKEDVIVRAEQIIPSNAKKPIRVDRKSINGLIKSKNHF